MIPNNRFINAVISTKLDDNKSLIEKTSYKGVYLWWFVDHDFRCFDGEITGEWHIPLRFNETLLAVNTKINFFLELTKYLFSRIIPKLCLNSKITSMKRNKILFTAQNVNWKAIFAKEKHRAKKTDAFYDSIISQLESTHEIIGVHPFGQNLARGVRVFIEKLLSWNVQHIPYERFWSPIIWKEGRRASKHFRNIWKTLQNDTTLKKLYGHRQKTLYKAHSQRLRFYFLIVFPMIVKYIEMAKKMIETEKPNSILLQNEYGSFERAITSAGKLKNVPIFAIQHGIITSETHFGLYMFDKRFKGQIILPFKTFVSGSYYKELLVEKSVYDSDQIVVTGAPRYDTLFSLPNVASRKEILEKYNVNLDHQIILWTTGCQANTWEENVRNIEAMVHIFRDFQQITLIIKQHPGEGAQYTKLMKKYLRTSNLANIVLVAKENDIFELIYAGDLLITEASTTALEAIAVNKPAIIFDLNGKEITIEYIREGVAIAVYNMPDLKETIKQLLKDDSILATNRPNFISSRLYLTDGNATNRVVAVINRQGR